MRTFMVQIFKQENICMQYMVNAENQGQAEADIEETIKWYGGNRKKYHGYIWEVPYTPNALKI